MKKLVILVCLTSMAFSSFGKQDPLGSPNRPIKIAMVPGQDSQKLMVNGRVLQKYLEEKIKLQFEVVVPQSFIAVVEAMGTQRVQIAMLNSFGYILANQKYGARASLMGMFKGRSEYWGQIIARADGPKTMEELNGKTFAFVNPASTSGYMLAKKALKDHNIKLKEYAFAGKHDSVVNMVYQGRVDAGATYHTLPFEGKPQDARTLSVTQYPDVFEKVKILKVTGPIPNDPVVYIKSFPRDLEAKINKAIKEFAKTPKGVEALMNLYHMDDLKDAKDSDWDQLRVILKEIEMSPNDFIKK